MEWYTSFQRSQEKILGKGGNAYSLLCYLSLCLIISQTKLNWLRYLNTLIYCHLSVYNDTHLKISKTTFQPFSISSMCGKIIYNSAYFKYFF